MTKTLKNKWLEALKSGEYKQGTCFLYNSNFDTYCCLGVLAKVINIEITDDIKLYQPKKFKQELLSRKILRRLKLSEIAQLILADLNDNSNNFLEKVIPWIEENL